MRLIIDIGMSAYDLAQAQLASDPRLVSFFNEKGVAKNMQVEAFADYIG